MTPSAPSVPIVEDRRRRGQGARPRGAGPGRATVLTARSRVEPYAACLGLEDARVRIIARALDGTSLAPENGVLDEVAADRRLPSDDCCTDKSSEPAPDESAYGWSPPCRQGPPEEAA